MTVFANTLQNEFVYDDEWTLARLPGYSYITSLAFLRTGHGLSYAVHLLDLWLWGPWPPGFHFTNIFLHSLASALVAYVTLALSGSTRVAGLCGALFAVHPVHVEAVASFANRRDVLAMVFVMLALILWCRRSRSLASSLGGLLCLGLGLLSKEVAAIGLLPMLFLADLLLIPADGASWSRRLRQSLVRFTPILLFGVLVTWMFAGDVRRYFTEESIHYETIGYLRTYDEVLVTAAGSVPQIARLLFCPRVLSVDYPVRTEPSVGDPSVILGLALFVCWIAGAILLIRRCPIIAFAMTWIVVTYLPTSNVVPLTQFFVAERYLYVPSFGACLVVGVVLDRAIAHGAKSGRGWLRLGACTVAVTLILAGGGRSVVRNRDWRDGVSLWSGAIEAGFETSRAHDCLGWALAKKGRYGEAMEHYLKASRMGSPNPHAMANLASLLLSVGRTEEAIHWCEEVLDLPQYNRQYREYQTRCGRILDVARRLGAGGENGKAPAHPAIARAGTAASCACSRGTSGDGRRP
jgi:tetratricopeptide (TPR) repeat protein